MITQFHITGRSNAHWLSGVMATSPWMRWLAKEASLVSSERLLTSKQERRRRQQSLTRQSGVQQLTDISIPSKLISAVGNLIGPLLSKLLWSSRNQVGMGRTWQLHRLALPTWMCELSLLTILMIPMVPRPTFPIIIPSHSYRCHPPLHWHMEDWHIHVAKCSFSLYPWLCLLNFSMDYYYCFVI